MVSESSCTRLPVLPTEIQVFYTSSHFWWLFLQMTIYTAKWKPRRPRASSHSCIHAASHTLLEFNAWALHVAYIWVSRNGNVCRLHVVPLDVQILYSSFQFLGIYYSMNTSQWMVPPNEHIIITQYYNRKDVSLRSTLSVFVHKE